MYRKGGETMPNATPEEINRIILTEEQAKTDTAFINSLKIDAQQIEGSRYKFRISESENE